MNEFTDKQIEQAAQQHAAELVLPPFFTPDAEATIRDIAKSSYIYGAQDALASQWVSVEERLPEPHEEVLTYTINAIDENAVAYYDGEDWYTIDGEHIRPHYWLPIPQLNPEKDER